MCLACLDPACTGVVTCTNDGAPALMPQGAAAPGAVRIVRDYTALIAGPEVRWNGFLAPGTPVFVTVRFVGAADLPDPAEYNPYGADAYRTMTEAQRANVRGALAHVAAQFGVTFVETDAPAMIDFLCSVGASVAGWANYPVRTETFVGSGRLVMNRGDDFAPGTSSYQVLLHELGHALGLKHPFERDVRLAADLDMTAQTLMSYTWVGGPRTVYSPLDIAALANLYGAPADLTGWTWRMAGGVFAAAGAAGGDLMIGVLGRNALEGMGGNDSIHGAGSSDTLAGGSGSDRLWGQGGDDLLDGGTGADALFGGPGNDTLRGGAGNDSLSGDDATAWGADLLSGGAGADVLDGGGGSDTLRGDGGNDTIAGGDGEDLLRGGAGDDSLSGEGWNDTLDGGKGDDTLAGGAWNDVLRGGAGRDLLFGGDGFDTLDGGEGHDTLDGGAGSDSLTGGPGNDVIAGGAGIDRLHGGAGNDVLSGGEDFDRLFGGAGRDTLTGGAGIDSFHFGTADLGFVDTITDYEAGVDQLILTGLGFARDQIEVLARGAGDAMLRIGGDAGIRVILAGVLPEDVRTLDVFL